MEKGLLEKIALIEGDQIDLVKEWENSSCLAEELDYLKVIEILETLPKEIVQGIFNRAFNPSK